MLKIAGWNLKKTEMTIKTDDTDFGLFDVQSCIEAIEALHAENPGMIEVDMKSVHPNVVDKAAELAGMSEFQIAKSLASTGKITF